MGVDPDQADVLILAAVELGDSGNRTRGHGMISAQRERNFSGFQSLQHKLGMLRAGSRDLFQILRVRVALFFLLGNRDGHIAPVLHFVTESFEPSFEAGYANRGRSHIHAAARLAKIKGNANNANLTGRDAHDRSGSSHSYWAIKPLSDCVIENPLPEYFSTQ